MLLGPARQRRDQFLSKFNVAEYARTATLEGTPTRKATVQTWHSSGTFRGLQGGTMYYERMQGDLGPPSGTPDTRLTYDDFLLFPDDGLRHEIIDGEHYVTPSQVPRHQVLLGR